MGGLLFGYDWVVIGGAKPFYEIFFGIAERPSMQALAMSIALLGCLLGATMAGLLADRYGRRRLLLFSALVFLGSSWATGAANHFTTFVLARLVGGIAIGLAADLSPMYIAEVAPKEVRGRLVTLNQLTIVIGILAAQVVNVLVAEPVPEGAAAADILASWNGQTDGAGCSGPCVCLRDSFSCWRCLFPRVRAGWPAVDAGTKPTAC